MLLCVYLNDCMWILSIFWFSFVHIGDSSLLLVTSFGLSPNNRVSTHWQRWQADCWTSSFTIYGCKMRYVLKGGHIMVRVHLPATSRTKKNNLFQKICAVDLTYLTEHILDVRCTVGIPIIIEVIHYPIVFCHQLLVSGIVTAAEVFIHLTELKFLLRLKGRFKIQTLRMQERRCDPKRQQIKQNKRRLPYTAENIAKVPHSAQILAPNFRYMEVKVMQWRG